MNKFDILITCSSWEDRFTAGIDHNLSTNDISSILIFGIEEFQNKTETSSNIILEKYSNKIVNNKINYISALNDAASWNMIKDNILDAGAANKKVLIDISTMPRYLIWFLLHFLSANSNDIHYCYFRPDKYPQCDWLTDEPLTPRLIFKHSGEHLPNRGLILIIQSGFDVERVSQLINTYEPEKVILVLQKGNQYDNLTKNEKHHKELLNFQEIEYSEIDAYADDHGYSKIRKHVEQYIDDKNILLASFGPKPLAVEMFKVNKDYPQIGLVDVPVRVYNEQYSHGTDFGNIQYGSI